MVVPWGNSVALSVQAQLVQASGYSSLLACMVVVVIMHRCDIVCPNSVSMSWPAVLVLVSLWFIVRASMGVMWLALVSHSLGLALPWGLAGWGTNNVGQKVSTS